MLYLGRVMIMYIDVSEIPEGDCLIQARLNLIKLTLTIWRWSRPHSILIASYLRVSNEIIVFVAQKLCFLTSLNRSQSYPAIGNGPDWFAFCFSSCKKNIWEKVEI